MHPHSWSKGTNSQETPIVIGNFPSINQSKLTLYRLAELHELLLGQ